MVPIAHHPKIISREPVITSNIMVRFNVLAAVDFEDET